MGAGFGALASVSALDRIHQGNMNASDPPRHQRLSGLVSRAFTPRSIAEPEPEIVLPFGAGKVDPMPRRSIAAN